MARMASGYTFQLNRCKASWQAAPDKRWDTVSYSPTGSEELVGVRYVDSARCTVFLCADGKYRAQLTHMLDPDLETESERCAAFAIAMNAIFPPTAV